MRRIRSNARRGARTAAGTAPAGGGALIAGIVLLLLLIAALFVALLYGTGALDGDPVDPFNLTGSVASGSGFGAPSPEST
jgi:hypothetical protein